MRLLTLLLVVAASFAIQNEPGVGIYLPLDPLNDSLQWITPVIGLLPSLILPDCLCGGGKPKVDQDRLVRKHSSTSSQYLSESIRTSLTFNATGGPKNINSTRSHGQLNFIDAIMILDTKSEGHSYFQYIYNLTLMPENDSASFDQNLFPEMNEQFMTALRDGSLAKFVASSLNEGLLLILQDMENFEVIPGHLSLNMSFVEPPSIVDGILSLPFRGAASERECSYPFKPLPKFTESAINVLLSDTTINCLMEALSSSHFTKSVPVGDLTITGGLSSAPSSEIIFNGTSVHAMINLAASVASKVSQINGTAFLDATLNFTLGGEKVSEILLNVSEVNINAMSLNATSYQGSEEFNEEIHQTDFNQVGDKLMQFVNNEIGKKVVAKRFDQLLSLGLPSGIAKVLDGSVHRKFSGVLNGAFGIGINLSPPQL
ncbi:hypothetical protein PROFUN_10434 [Planoprotostelium fungivorum]|uniref:Lipid-binding serum glycoprotein C-terminal domain-containing protein n=1 Tax=Planoprotostelium fungivorum TaxID=1890364 RepID=A0A2P6NDW9_9EUKA|nr:hypothetical protein PROFUN_10434 [Planoprotostelium fungivorum]